MAKRIFLGLCGVLLSLLGLGYWFMRPPADMPTQIGQDGTSLREIAGCSEALPWDQQSRVTAFRKNGNQLVATVIANENCGPVLPVEPRASVRGETVEIGWNWWSRPNSPMAACKCTRHIEFTVPNVEAANPVISISKSNL
jgi:hypothetical protein